MIKAFVRYTIAVIVLALGFLAIDEGERERDEFNDVLMLLAGEERIR